MNPQLLKLILVDVLLGYVPQAAGCAICLFMINRVSINSRKYYLTACIFAAIAIFVRTSYNIGLIDFGFHTVFIWALFILIAIWYDKFPAMQSICSILLSGILIAAAELLTAGIMIMIHGDEKFTAIMNNTATIEGKITKAAYGIPANMLFVLLVFIIYHIRRTIKKRKLRKQGEQNGTLG